MNPIEKRIECGCFSRFAPHEYRKPSREIPREELNIPFFADPEEDMRWWNGGSDSGVAGGVINAGEQEWD